MTVADTIITRDAVIVLDKILDLMAQPGFTIVGANGRTASGKSTLADFLVAAISAEYGDKAVAYVQLDNFLPKGSDATQPGADWQGYEWHAFEAMLRRAREGEQQFVRLRDWESGEFTGGLVKINRETQIVIVEGVGIFQDHLLPYYDYKIWVECTAEESVERGMARSAATPKPGGGTYAEDHRELWPKWREKDDDYIKKHRPAEKAAAIYVTSQQPESERIPVTV